MGVDDRRLAEIAALPESHPERINFCRDSYQRTLLAEYLSFLEADPAADSRPGAAHRELGEFLEARIAQGRPQVASRSPRPRWAARVALAAAAVVVIAVGLQFNRSDLQAPSRVQRGGTEVSIQLIGATVLGGNVEFRWTSLDEAEDYVLVVTAADLSEAYRSGALADTSLVVDALEIAAAGDYTWRVVARSHGDPIAQTSLGTVHLP